MARLTMVSFIVPHRNAVTASGIEPTTSSTAAQWRSRWVTTAAEYLVMRVVSTAAVEGEHDLKIKGVEACIE